MVGNGRLVLDALERKAYDLILMDIQMPVLNGIEAASLVRGTYGAAAPAIVALTAEALEGDEERFLSLGFDHYLSKPAAGRTAAGFAAPGASAGFPGGRVAKDSRSGTGTYRALENFCES